VGWTGGGAEVEVAVVPSPHAKPTARIRSANTTNGNKTFVFMGSPLEIG
jgi:hypothetical protein